MSFASFVSIRRSLAARSLPQLGLLLVLGACLWGGAVNFQDARAQDETGPCADTLATAETAYRTRDYQRAVSLASPCTDPTTVTDTTAIRAYRVITLASLRQGNLERARSAVQGILQIDPEYQADPVNDPPSYDLLVTMLRREEAADATADAAADTMGATAADTTRTAGADRTAGEDAGTTESAPAQLQPESEETGVFLKFGGGFSDFTGDFPAEVTSHPFDFQEFRTGNGSPWLVTAELGYAFTPTLASVLGYQGGNYPIAGFDGPTIENSHRHTLQAMVRYTFGAPEQTVSPYVDGGVNVTFGGDNSVGAGPTVGGGVGIGLSERTSFYVESRFNLTFPDEAIDDVVVERKDPAPFDMVNQLLGVGLRIRLGG